VTMRASVALLLLILFRIDFSAAGSESERSEAPKAYSEIPIKISPLDIDDYVHSQRKHHGQKTIKAEPRIVGGTPTGPNVYQFFTRVDTSGNPYCGGTLVAPDVVLTAGHCLSDNLSVVVNGYDLYSSDGALQYPREVAYTIRHPDFNPVTYDNDAMLLKLSSPVDTEFVTLNFDDANPRVGDDLTVMGLGNKEEDGAPASSLLAVTVQVVDYDTCKANYNAVGLDVNDDIMLCAGNTVEGGRDVRAMKRVLLSL